MKYINNQNEIIEELKKDIIKLTTKLDEFYQYKKKISIVLKKTNQLTIENKRMTKEHNLLMIENQELKDRNVQLKLIIKKNIQKDESDEIKLDIDSFKDIINKKNEIKIKKILSENNINNNTDIKKETLKEIIGKII